MRLLRQKDYPDGKFTLAFLGYGEESDNTVIELTYNWGVDHYEIGSGYGISPSRSMTSTRRPPISARVVERYCARPGR